MRSSFTGLELSKRSLFTHQTALQTTGHNISNANTKGYSRQVVNITASRPMEAIGMMRSNAPGQIGTGVEYSSINRLRERFLDKQFYNENKSFGEWTVRKDTLEKLEAIVNEPSDNGLRKVMDNYWNAWQELSMQPDNPEARMVVKESGIALADAFNHITKKLNDLRADLTDNIDVKVTEVNMTLQMIRNLNREIYRTEGLGNNSNDLRDQRDLLVDQLAKVVNITVVEEDRGYHIMMGGQELVRGNEATNFDLALFNAAYTAGDLNSGELYGLRVSIDRNITGYQAQVNALAKTIADAVNEKHAEGYTLKSPLSFGGAFFTYDPANPSLSMKVSDAIVNDVELIAASKRFYTEGTVDKVIKGNNENALALAGLKNAKFPFDGSGIDKIALSGGTFDEFFRAIVGELGVQTQEAKRQFNNQQILVDQIESRRESVSGVSLDEEMSNMIKFQHGYNAAARFMTSYDEILDKIINGMGVVGR